MVDFIVDKFDEIICKACVRYAKKYSEQGSNVVNYNEVQVLFKLDDELEVKYSLMKNYVPIESVTFNQLRGVKFDISGYSLIVPPFIKKTLLSFGDSLCVHPTLLSIICVCVNEEETVLYLYNGRDFVEQIKIEDLL